MFIENIRLGFANNSSSSHSIVFNPNRHCVDTGGAQESASFGWESSTLDSTSQKAEYLATIYFENLPDSLTFKQKTMIMKELFGITVTEPPYIDHQSSVRLPKVYECAWDNTPVLSEAFWEAFSNYVMHENVQIETGNDNGDSPDSREGDVDLYVPQMGEGSKGVLVREDHKDFWVLFNPETGAKSRIYLGDPTKPTPEHKKSFRPELVDLKITDYCPFGCAFCYQASTMQGKHASKEDLSNLVSSMCNAGVLEVAIGGGEPTQHPDFPDVLRSISDAHMMASFTTFNLNWVEKPEVLTAVEKYVCSFAISNPSRHELEKIKEWNNSHPEGPKITVQLVENIREEGYYRDIILALEKSYIPVTLLGYKTNGRGGEFEQKDSSAWISSLLFSRGGIYRIGIDTAFAKNHAELLEKEKVEKTLYFTEEGKYSFYIDAVKKTAHPSSYSTGQVVELETKAAYWGRSEPAITADAVMKAWSVITPG